MARGTKIPRDDPRAAYIARTTTVDRAGLADFVGDKHRWILVTTRADGRPQMSPVTGAMIPSGELAISTYPERAKAGNVRRRPLVSLMVMGAEFNDAWVQIDGTARVVDLPEAGDLFVEYYRSISGEHPDWDEFRAAMVNQGKCLIRVSITDWGPIAKGGFPSRLAQN